MEAFLEAVKEVFGLIDIIVISVLLAGWILLYIYRNDI